MIPAAISHMQASSFRTEIDIDGDVMESTSTHPCHRLSIPAARLFWCRHCMQIFEDPITRWRHSKTCLHSSSGKVRKDKDGSTMQVFLSANNLSALRREQNRSRVISRSVGPGHSPGTDLRCFICKMTFVSIEEMRVHVRNPCRKRPTLAVPKHKYSALPAEIKTQIQIPDTASEIIYIKDGHQTVISLESPCTAEVLKTELVEPSQEYEPDNVSGTEEVFIFPDTFDSTTNLNAIERTVEISAVETVVPFSSKSEEVAKPPKNRKENKENNVRMRKRILPKEVDDRPNHKTNNSQKSDQQIALSLPTKPDDAKDVLDDFEAPPIKISKMTNKDPEDETSQATVQAKPLQTKEEYSQLLIAEKDNQLFLGGEHLPNGVVTEQVTDEAMLLKALASPVEKIVTGAAAEARLKDLFTTMEMQNKTKLYLPPKQTKTVSYSPKSLGKTGSPTNIRNDDIDKCQNDDLEKDERQLSISQEEIDTAGLLLYMPPINAGSVTLPDPLLDLQSGLPAEMLLDETTNTNPPIPTAPEVITAFFPSDIMEETKLPSHIFDGDLLPSQIHSEVLFEEIIDEKENPPLVDNRLVEELVPAETNLEEAVKIESPVGINEVEGEIEEFTPVGEITTVVEVGPPTPKHPEENQEIPLEESELEQVNNEESALPIAESLEMSNQTAEANPAEKNAEMKTKDEANEEEEASIAEKTEIETKHKSTKLFKCKACSNIFKTSQALQKHSRVPCKIKHTRSLSQKILRPKQPCLKIEKKPMKKKMVKPMRRPKLMIPIIPITRSELIRPAVPRRPRRFSRRKRKKCFFSDEQKRILPFVNVLMSELSDKDRFFYKLGMINQCRKIPSSETTTSTAPNSEAPAVEMLGDSAEQSSLKLQFPGIKTESTYPPEIAPLSPAEVVAAEPQRISYSASPAVAAACVSDQENPCALAKGLCLSLPTLEKMEDNQFHDPNCISPSHVKPEPPDPPRDSSEVTGQSVQSPCWEAAPHNPNCISPSHVKPEPPDPPRDHSGVTGQSVQSPCWEAAPHDPNCISPSHVKPEPPDPLRDSSGVTGQSVQSPCWEAAPHDPNCISPSHVKPEPPDPPRDSSGVTGQSVQSPCWEATPHDPNCISPSHLKPEPPDPPRDSSGVTGQSVQSPCWEAAPHDPNCISPSHVKPEPPDPPRDSSEVTGQSVQSPCWEAAPDDPNCISPSHVKPEPPDPPRDPSGVTGQSVQSPCWEAAPRLAQLPGVTQIVRVTSANPSSADLLNGIDTNKPSVTHESDQSNILANGKSFSFANSSSYCKTQSKKISKEMVNDSNLNISGHLAAKNLALKWEESEEPLGNVFQNNASQPETISASLQELSIKEESCSDAVQKDSTNLADNNPNKKIRPNSVSKVKIQKTKTRKKAGAKSKKQLRKGKIISPDNTNTSRSSVNKKSTKFKLNLSRAAKHKVIKPINPTKNHNRINERNQKQTDSCTGANIEMRKKKHRSVDSSISNSQNRISSSLSRNVTSLSSKKVTSNRNFAEPASSCKKVASSQVSHMATTTLCKKVASSQESHMATTTLCKKVASSQESHMATTALCKKVASSRESHMATTTLCKKVASSPESHMATTTLCKKVASSQESPIVATALCKKVASSQESPIAATALCKKVASSQESPIAATALCKKVASSQESQMATTTLCKKVASSQESQMATTALCKKVDSSQESPIATTTLCKKVASSQESHMATTALCKKVASSQESHMATTTLCKKLASCWNSTMPTPSSSSKQHSPTLSKKTESNPGTPVKENRNLVSVKIENCSESGLSNDQNRTSPISPPSAITSPLSSKAVCSGGSDSVSDQARPNPLSLCQSKTLAHQMQEDRIGQPVIKRENNLEQPPLKDTVVQPMLKSLCIDVFEETLKNLSDANNERQRHFSDIFGHEKVSLVGEDSDANYQISPSKERSKRHFTDFLCAFSEEASAPRVESTAPVHSGFSQEKIKSIKIEEPNLSEYLKTNETFAKSTSLNEEKRDVRNIISPYRDSEDSQKSSGIGCSNILQVAEIPAVSCLKQNNREFGNEQFVRMMESPNKSVLKNEKLKEDIKPFPMSGECHSESPVTELLSGESLLNSGSSDPHKTEATAVVTISNTAVTTVSSCSGNNSIVTNSSPVEYQTPFQNSETPFNLSTTATSNPRVSIATQTDSSFLKETKTELSVPSCSCDNVEKNEPPPVSFNPDPPPPLPSSTTTNTTPTPTSVDDVPPPTVLSKEESSEELVQENMYLDTCALPLPPEIVINDNHLSPVSPSPETTCSPVQGERGLQENTEVSVLLQQSVPAPSTVATESPRQQLVLDNMTDPNVLVQYLNSLDPSMLPQEVTFVIIQGTPGEPLHVTDDHNFIIEQTAFSEHAEQESANSSVIYTLQPQSDIATEAECIMTDSS